MNKDEKLSDLQRKTEALDIQILRLLNERAKLALEENENGIKAEAGIPGLDSPQQILQLFETQAAGPFPRQALLPVYREILSACRSLKAPVTVAYFGPPGTNTHQACNQFFGSSVTAIPQETIPDIFEFVERKRADFGVVPVENSTEGAVNRTLDQLVDTELKIRGELSLRISHDLLSESGNPAQIKKVYSHPQALAQCRQWLRKNLPQAELVEVSSTARGAQMAAAEPETAAVAPAIASQLYGLKTVASGIEDFVHNYTRFLILGHECEKPTGKDKTSLLFSIVDSPGSLYEALKSFSEKSINLAKIESRPIKGRPWKYLFFLDLEGHAEDVSVKAAMRELNQKALFMKFLGSYPRSS
jgi:chorismate mutase/prephenate dehydratase